LVRKSDFKPPKIVELSNEDITLKLAQESLEWTKSMSREVQQLSEAMRSLVTLSQGGKVTTALEDVPVYVTIPDGGDAYALAAGDTYIDFYLGTITSPTGGESRLRLGLKGKGMKYMRSFLIVTDRTIKVSLDGGGFHSLKAGEGIAFGGFPVRQVYIQATEATAIRCIASTATQLTTFYDRAFSTDNPSVPPLETSLEDASTADAQTISLDLGDFSRNKVEVFGTSTVALDWYYETSPDNEHWWTEEAFSGETSIHTGYDNVCRYQRLRTAAGAAGTVSMFMVAGR
jgi:hypothetical protein